MATIVLNQDGTATITLTAIEQQTMSGLQDDSLEQYITLWLEEKSKQFFNDRFKQLPPAKQASILAQFVDGV